MSQGWRVVGNTVFDLTCPIFEPDTSRSNDKRVTAQTTGLCQSQFPSRKTRCSCQRLVTVATFLRKNGVVRWRNNTDRYRPTDSSHTLALLKKHNIELDFLQVKSPSYSLHYAEAGNELAGPISASLRLQGSTASFKEMLQRWQVVGNIVRLDRLEIKISDLPLQRPAGLQTYYRLLIS